MEEQQFDCKLSWTGHGYYLVWSFTRANACSTHCRVAAHGSGQSKVSRDSKWICLANITIAKCSMNKVRCWRLWSVVLNPLKFYAIIQTHTIHIETMAFIPFTYRTPVHLSSSRQWSFGNCLFRSFNLDKTNKCTHGIVNEKVENPMRIPLHFNIDSLTYYQCRVWFSSLTVKEMGIEFSSLSK